MASSHVPKVVLKNTTAMSLNERFTEMLANQQPVRVTIQAMVRREQEQKLERERQVLERQVLQQDDDDDDYDDYNDDNDDDGDDDDNDDDHDDDGDDDSDDDDDNNGGGDDEDDDDDDDDGDDDKREQEDRLPPRARSRESLRPRTFLTQVNSGNGKLGRQTESRPSVRPAATLKADTIKQAGKSNVRARLGWPFGSLARRAVGGFGDPSNGGPSHGSLAQRVSTQRGSTQRGSTQRGFSRKRGLSRAAWGEMQGERVSRSRRWGNRETQSPQDEEPRQSRSASFQMSVRKGGGRRSFGWGGSTGHRGVSTGRREYRSGVSQEQGLFGRSGRRRHVPSQAPLTKEQLDKQLDAYMAKSRGHVDAEVDTYMAQID